MTSPNNPNNRVHTKPKLWPRSPSHPVLFTKKKAASTTSSSNTTVLSNAGDNSIKDAQGNTLRSTGLHESSSHSDIHTGSDPLIPNQQGIIDHAKNVVVDVLPSFEMYNTLHRHIPQGNVDADIHDFPPTYMEVQHSTNASGLETNSNSTSNISVPGLANSSSPLHQNTGNSNQTNNNNSESPNYNLNSLRPLFTQHLNLSQVNPSSSSSSNNIPTTSSSHTSLTDYMDTIDVSPEDDLNDTNNVAIDKLYSLPKLTTPVQIEIHLTKEAAIPHQPHHEASILTEYTSGDMVHGYCIIENKSTQPLKFEMFYVTLEAYISIIDKQRSKRTLKRFLRMVDLSASWSYANIILSSGATMVGGDIDHDNCQIGLNNSRILEPGKRYKKYFMFKLPSQMLDSACKQNIFIHCLLPPSFGIDRYRSNGQYSGIKINNTLGCGHLGLKGSPVLVRDHCDENISINYTIDARIVGKDKKNSKLFMMKEQSFYLRVIPFTFSPTALKQSGERSVRRQIADLQNLIEERLISLEKIFKKLAANKPFDSLDIQNSELTGTITDNIISNVNNNKAFDERFKKNQDVKNSQLFVNVPKNASNENLSNRGKAKGTRIKKPSHLPGYSKNESVVESELNYKLSGKTLFKNLWNHSGDPNYEDRAGMIVAQAAVPKSALGYTTPSLIRKSNLYQNKPEQAQKNWNSLYSFLNSEESELLDHIYVKLVCIESNNSIDHIPPEVSAIQTELVCITTKSDNSIPVRLNHDFLVNEKKLNATKEKFSLYFKRIGIYAKKFEENKKNLNRLYNEARKGHPYKELKYVDFISPQLYNDVESLANLKVDIKHLPNVFAKQTIGKHVVRPPLQTFKSSSTKTPQVPPPLQTRTSPIFNSLTSSKTLSSLNLENDMINSDDIIRPISSSSLSHDFLQPTRSSSSIMTAKSKINQTNQNVKKTNLTESWTMVESRHYEKKIKVNLTINPESRDTLIPDFQSCLIGRMYMIKITVKFKHAGDCVLWIPVSVRTLGKAQ